MNLHEYLPALVGGALIGVSASMVLLLHGRIAGISGIVAQATLPNVPSEDRRWGSAFLLGLIGVGIPLSMAWPGGFTGAPQSLFELAAAGLLVGFGTRLGSGCTSGHGVCGISRLAPRSIFATAVFIVFGIVAARLLGAPG